MIEITRIIGIMLLAGSGSAWAAGVYAAESEDQLPGVIEQPEQLDLDDPQNETDEPDDANEPMPGQPLQDSGPPPSASDDEDDGSEFAMDLPLDPELRRKMREELYLRLGKEKDVKSAEPIAESIERLWRMSGSATVDLLIARAEIFQGVDPDLSMQILNSVVDLAPEDPEGWHQRGRLYAAKKDYERAASDLRKALSLDDQHYKAWRQLGDVLQATGDKQGADDAFGKAEAINPFLDELSKKPVIVPPPDDGGQDI